MWLTVAQLAQNLNKSERAVRKAISTGRYSTARYEEGAARGGSAGKVWTISAYDPAIPDTVRRNLGIEERAVKLKAKMKEDAQMTIKPENLENGQTAQRLRVVRRAESCPEGVKMRDWLEWLSRDENVSIPTIYRWVKDSKRGKIVSDRAPVPVSLEASSGPLRITVRTRSFAPQAMEYGIALLMNNQFMDTKTAYNELAAEASSKGWEIGSMQSFYRAVASMPEIMRILTQRGRRGVEAISKPPIYRDINAYGVYEELVGDQHIFDYIVLDADGEPIRPEMFVWGDTRSRYLTGVWPVMGHYDKYSVGLSLREACRWGIPQLLHTDWGKPECSKYVQQLRRQLAGFSAFKSGDCGWMDMDWTDGELKQYKSKPRNAQAKPIESWFFHAFERPLMQMGLPGYARRSFEEKENEYIQSNLRKDIKKQNLLTATEFFEIVFKKVQEWNQHVMSDKSVPEEVFMKGIEAANLYRFDDQSLDFMFLPSEKRKVTKSLVGINIGGTVMKWHSPAIALMNGKTVEVRYDPYDIERAYILDINSHELIDIAQPWDRIDPHDKEAFVKKIRIQNALLRDISNIGGQLANKVQTRIHKISPYAAAAAEAVKLDSAREELVINSADVDSKFINLGNTLLQQQFRKIEKVG